MRLAPTRLGPLLLLAAVAFALTTAGLQLRQAAGAATAAPPVVAAVVTAALAFAVLVVAWPVRRWNAGARDRAIDPLRAARTVALATSSALAGALLTGGWVGYVGVALPAVTLASQPGRVATTAAVVLASVGLTVAGLVAERWCMIPPADHDDWDDRDWDDRDDRGGGGGARGGGRRPSPA